VAEQNLDDADIRPALQKMGGETMPLIPNSELAA
jgi:hypothetical protein